MENPNDYDKYPKRKNPRLSGYDYSTQNYYFITICTHEKSCIFGTPNMLNLYGKYAYEGMQQIPQHFPDVSVEKFVVMPNHIHAILFLHGKGSNLERVIGSYKSYVSKKVHRHEPDRRVWQDSFHDHIIRNEKSYQNIWLYIEGNPANWEKDCFYFE